MEYKNKEKLKEQNSSRITEPKNGLTVTKGKGTGHDGWEGREKGGEKERGPLRLACIMWGWHREGCATQRRQVVSLQHLTMLMDSDCNGVCGGGRLVKGVSHNHNVLHVIVD